MADEGRRVTDQKPNSLEASVNSLLPKGARSTVTVEAKEKEKVEKGF